MLFLCNSLWPVLPVLLRLFVASFVEHWSFKSYKCFSPELVKMASEIFFELKTERAASTGSCALTMHYRTVEGSCRSLASFPLQRPLFVIRVVCCMCVVLT